MIVHTSIATTSDAASWEQALVDAVDFLTAGQVVALPSERRSMGWLRTP